MVIIDTTVWVDYLRGQQTPETGWLDREDAFEHALGLAVVHPA